MGECLLNRLTSQDFAVAIGFSVIASAVLSVLISVPYPLIYFLAIVIALITLYLLYEKREHDLVGLFNGLRTELGGEIRRTKNSGFESTRILSLDGTMNGRRFSVRQISAKVSGEHRSRTHSVNK